MSHRSLDLIHGRRGGRRLDTGRIVPGIDDVETGPAICLHGHRFTDVAQRDLGKPCIVDGHPVRRPTKAELARAPHVIRTVTAAGLSCPCEAVPSTTRRSA